MIIQSMLLGTNISVGLVYLVYNFDGFQVDFRGRQHC